MTKSAPHLKLVETPKPKPTPSVEAQNFSVWIGNNCILSGVDASIPKQGVTCIVGPSGSGKSTFLRSLNRINDDVPGFNIQGDLLIDGKHIYNDFRNVTRLRAHIGMVFQKPCVFPRSIRENVLFGVRGRKLSRSEKNALVESSLRSAALWSEVSQRLDEPASVLSLGQQQRLCIARTLATKPEIILLDEPTASVDPVTARAIEDMILSLKDRYTIVMVTHDIRQTKRIADTVMFFCDGQLIESGTAKTMFGNSQQEKTRIYLNEEFCDC